MSRLQASVKANLNKWVELCLLFIVTPILLALSIPFGIKLTSVIVAVIWLLIQCKNEHIFRLSFSRTPASKSFLYRVFTIAGIILIGGSIFLYNHDQSMLFSIVREKPLVWVIILFVYAFLSVVPQEFVYRRYFFERYESLFSNQNYLFALNIFCFSLCHLFLWNGFVLFLTAIGGVLFAYTYKKEGSLNWVSLEHSIYGNLIFTIGLGEMLAFPT